MGYRIAGIDVHNWDTLIGLRNKASVPVTARLRLWTEQLAQATSVCLSNSRM